jgi:2-desacetyl-2-hydroxyethyl bacteriochlorophyllide A dehydrogenase
MARQILITAPRKAEVRDAPDEPLLEGQIRVRADWLGISAGTELNTWRGGVNWHTGRDKDTRLFHPDAEGQAWRYPAPVGYAHVGRVVEVGPGVQGWKLGDAVFSTATHSNPSRVLVSRAFRVPAGMDPRGCAFFQLVKTALNLVQHARPALGDTVAIFGLGMVGLLTLQLARRAGARRVVVFDPLGMRREAAARLGADHALDPREGDPGRAVRGLNDGRGADVAIECSANREALHQCTRVVGAGGRVILGAMPGEPFPFHFGREVHFNGVSIHGANVMQLPRELGGLWDLARRDQAAAGLLAGLEIASLITHEFDFEQAPSAYEFLDARPQEVLGAVLRCPPG